MAEDDAAADHQHVAAIVERLAGCSDRAPRVDHLEPLDSHGLRGRF